MSVALFTPSRSESIFFFQCQEIQIINRWNMYFWCRIWSREDYFILFFAEIFIFFLFWFRIKRTSHFSLVSERNVWTKKKWTTSLTVNNILQANSWIIGKFGFSFYSWILEYLEIACFSWISSWKLVKENPWKWKSLNISRTW